MKRITTHFLCLKDLKSLFMILVFILPMEILAQTNLNNGLIGYYPLDGDVKDYGTNKLDGVASNIEFVEGKSGKAAQFNGENGGIILSNYVDQMKLSPKHLTVSLWAKFDRREKYDYGGLILNFPCGYGLLIHYPINSENFDLNANIRISGESGGGTVFSPYKDVWRHFVLTYDEKDAKIYIDGVLEKTSPLLGTISYCGQGSVGLGNYSGFLYKGLMDEVRIYDRAISYDEVKELYGQPLVDIKKGLVAYYPFNGKDKDESGNDYHVQSNSATLTNDRFGKPNSAYHFNGTSSFMSVPYNTPFVSENHSISAWIKTSKVSGYGRIVVLPNQGGQHFSLNVNTVVPKKASIYFDNSDGSGATVAYSTKDVTDGAWHHLVGIINMTDKKMNVYLDGILDGTINVTKTPISSTSPLQIGRFSESEPEYFEGDIDDIRIYNRAINNAEVKELYEFLNDGLVAYYPFNGDYKDKSENGIANDGIPTGTTLETDRLGNANSKSCRFNGTSDFIRVPNSTSLNPEFMTVAAWIKPTAFYEGTCGHSIILTKGGDINNTGGYGIGITGTNVCTAGRTTQTCTVGVNTGSQNYVSSIASEIKLNEWQLLVGTYDGKEITYYLNGKFVNKTPIVGKILACPDDIFIGAFTTDDRKQGRPYWFNGWMDDIRIYNRAINDAEVKELYGQPIDPLEQGLIAIYPLNGNETDTGPNKFDGKKQGAIDYPEVLNGVKAGKFNGNSSAVLLAEANTPTSSRFAFFSPKKFTISARFSKDGLGTIVRNGSLGYRLKIKKGSLINQIELEGSIWAGANISPLRITEFKINHAVMVDKEFLNLVTFTYDGTNLALYHNGKFLKKEPKNLGGLEFMYLKDDAVTIGKDGKNGDYFKGLLQDVRFYDKVLSDVDIRKLYSVNFVNRTFESMSPKSIGRGAPFVAIVKGKGFTENLTAKLIKGGSLPLVATKISPVSPTELKVEWNLPTDAELGKYNLEISGYPDGITRTLDKALDIQTQKKSELRILLVSRYDKIRVNRDVEYRITATADIGNIQLTDVRIHLVVQAITKNSQLVVRRKNPVGNFPNFSNLTPVQLEELNVVSNDFIPATDENGMTSHTFVLSKAVLDPGKPEPFVFTVKSTNIGDKFVIVLQGTPIPFEALNREETGCSDCTKCSIDLAGFAPLPGVGCASGIAGVYCSARDYNAKEKIGSWLNIGAAFVGGILSCASGPIGKSLEKALIPHAKALVKVAEAESTGSGVLSADEDCKNCDNPERKYIKPISVIKLKEDTDPKNNTYLRILEGDSIKTAFIKYGPDGFTDDKYTQSGRLMPYIIEFENKTSSTAPVGMITIKDQLDTSIFDLSTFRFASYGWGDTTLYADDAPNPDFLGFDYDLRPKKNAILRHLASIDRVTGAIEYRFSSLDPDTYDPIVDKNQGFLPPNDSTRKGFGFIEYLVETKTNLAHGTKVKNKMAMGFDSIPLTSSPYWINTIDAIKPLSRIKPLPIVSKDTIIKLILESSDIGSGVESYDIYVSVNNTSFRRVGKGLQGDTLTFIGKNKVSYRFFSQARDNVGNWEDTTHTADATIKIDITNPVTELKTGQLKIYPNPTVGTVYIESPWENASAQIIVSDIIGRTVLQQKSIQTKVSELDLRSFSAGIYFISLKNERTGETKVGKVVHE
jgi:Concanavalin A-like lectin/glucanases superfamily/Secretion system C-terminal sorting domain